MPNLSLKLLNRIVDKNCAFLMQRDPSPRQARLALHRYRVHQAMQTGPSRLEQLRKKRNEDLFVSSPRFNRNATSAEPTQQAVPRNAASAQVSLALQGKGQMRSEADIEQLLVFINQVPLLQQLSERVRRRLCELASLVYFESGQVIMGAGELAEKYYVVVAGEVEVFYRAEPRWVAPRPPVGHWGKPPLLVGLSGCPSDSTRYKNLASLEQHGR